MVKYLENQIAESADSTINNGVRYSTLDIVLGLYNSNNYKYEISYYRPRSYKK